MVLSAGAVSCGKEGPSCPDGGQGPLLEISPSAEDPSSRTKGICEGGGPLDGSYTVFLSAWMDNATASEESGNYFRGREFTSDGGGSWTASPALYWPLGGSLEFLSLALSDASLGRTAVWYGDNVSKGVELTVPDRSSLDSEVMYSRASSRKSSGGAVSLEFSHSQAWLRFEFARYEPGTVRLDSLVIRKAYTGGALRVESGVWLEAGWDFHGFFRRDLTLPGSRDLLLSNPPTVLDILLPEQGACALEVWYTKRASADAPWGEGQYHLAEASADPWHAGTRTTYTLIIRKKLEITSSVGSWDEEQRPVTIN